MKRIICGILSLLLVLSFVFTAAGCGKLSTPKEHDVILVLLKEDGTELRQVLTSRESGSTIYEPKEYKIYPSLINGYVVVDDFWHRSADLSSPEYFPLTMPDNDVEFYATIRPLTDISSITITDPSAVYEYFSSNAKLQDEYYWITPNESNETSYYEISENSLIKDVMRYYPATQKLFLMRGLSKTENLGAAILQDEYTVGISIDLANKSITCKGIYKRSAASSSSASGGSVTITYDVNKMSIDDPTIPLFPNFETVKYTYEITDATNYSKMQELWNDDGYSIARQCYSQARSVLKSISKHIMIFS